MKTKITQNPNIFSLKRFINNIVTKKKAMSFFLILFSLFWMPKSLNALDIHLLKSPSDGPEIMKKYSIVRSVDDDGYVIAGSTFIGTNAGMAVNVMLVDDFGSIVWSYYYGYPAVGFEATHIDYNRAKDGYVICGFSNIEWNAIGPTNTARPFVLEIDDVGAQVRHRFIDLYGAFVKIKPTPKGNYIAVGFINDTTLASPKYAVAIKFDFNLNTIWSHEYHGGGIYNTLPSSKHYEGIQGIYATYDGVNETYVLGGNFTAPFTSLSTGRIPDPINSSNWIPQPVDYFIPIIDLREIDENGNIISQKQEIAVIWGGNGSGGTLSHPYCQDIIIQDLLVIEDPFSEYYNELIIVGQQIPYHNYDYGSDGHYLVLGKYDRNSLTRKQDYVAMHGVLAFPFLNNYVRGNEIKYLNNKLYLFGSMEEIDHQIPALIEIDPILSMNSSDYNTTFFRDLSALSVAKYVGNKTEFPDYLGIGSSHSIIGTVAGQTFGHSLGFVDLDGSNQLRYGIISRRKYQLSSTDWSLFLVSNVDNEFCYIHEDNLVFETSYESYIDTFQVYSRTAYIPYTILTIFDSTANFNSVLCASNELVWSSVDEIEGDKLSLSFYPNPATNEINITGLKGNEEYIIYDLKGVVVLSGSFDQSHKLILSKLNVGIYFIEVKTSNNVIFREKFSKL